MSTRIHPTAVVSPEAELGDQVEIGPYVVVEADVSIGSGTRLQTAVVIKRYTRIGSECEIHTGAVIGDVPQDRNFKPCRSWVVIGDGSIVRECVTIHRGTTEESCTRLGKNCFLMALSHVAHDCVLGNNVVLANGALVAGHVQIGDGAFISGNCLLHQFVRVGRLAMLGGGAGVSKDVPPFCLVAPLELNTVSGLNVVGLRRAGVSARSRTALRRAFRSIFCSGQNLRNAAAEFAGRDQEDALVRELAGFVLESGRGVCRFRAAKETDETGL
ncbi:MAG TPA: acyl-ACP--UDP-N-acetylglucosamine O-acyltransferase [Kiritimatiellae bacterium]|nr:acyl-ACP--UDP-N-acetylglucosamine O-acyltransferase [Kiritimatiellia bacterium]